MQHLSELSLLDTSYPFGSVAAGVRPDSCRVQGTAPRQTSAIDTAREPGAKRAKVKMALAHPAGGEMDQWQKLISLTWGGDVRENWISETELREGERSERGGKTFGNDDKWRGTLKFKLAQLVSNELKVTWCSRVFISALIHCWFRVHSLLDFGRDPRGVQGVGSRRERLHLQTGAWDGHALSGLHAQRGGAGHHHAETRHGRWVTWTPTDAKM